MKQNRILNTIATIAMAFAIAIMSAQAAGAVTLANVDFPNDIALDSSGNIYVADTGNNTIQKLSPTGVSLQTIGSGVIEFPSGVAVDSAGNIYVADDVNRSILIFNSIGVLRQTVGSGLLNSPDSVAVDGAGNMYVADRDPLILTNNRIVIFNSAGSFLQTVGSDLLNSSDGVALDSAGNIYVADSGNNSIQKFSSAGALLQSVGGLNFPNGVALDSAGKIYVADTGSNSIKVFNPDGSLQQTISADGGPFSLPMGVAVDSAGKIYVADAGNNRIQVIGAVQVPLIADITAFDVGSGNRAGTINANVTVMNLDIVPHRYATVVSGVNLTRGFPLAGTGVVVNLNPGQSTRIPVRVTVPASADPGSYDLFAGVFPFDNEILPELFIGDLAGPGAAVVS